MLATKAGDPVADLVRARRERVAEAVEDLEDTMKASSYGKDWRSVAAALRFGAGAAVQSPGARRSEAFTSTLANDWGPMDSEHGWPVVQADAHRGFVSARDRSSSSPLNHPSTGGLS